MSFKERLEKVAADMWHLPQFRAARSLRPLVVEAVEAYIDKQEWGLSPEEIEHLALLVEATAHAAYVTRMSPRAPRVPLADAVFLESFTLAALIYLSKMVDSGEAEAIIQSLREEEELHGIQ